MNPSTHDTPARPSHRSQSVNRRTIVKGAAWSVPAVAVASAAPAFALSQVLCTPTGCPTNVSANSPGWIRTAVGSIKPGTGSTGYKAGWTPATGCNGCNKGEYAQVCGGSTGGGPYNVLIAEEDPAGPNAALIVSQNVCLAAGTKVTFSFDYATYASNRIPAYLQAFIDVNDGTTPTLGGTALTGRVEAPYTKPPTNTVNIDNVNKKGSVVGTQYTVPTTGSYTIKMVWTFGTPPSGTNYGDSCASANDIGAYNISIACV